MDVESYINSLTDSRIKLSRLENNSGFATALNFLLELVLKNTEYKFIARMDADDISMPARFDKQRNFLLENSDITVLGSWYEEIDESGKHLSYRKLLTEHEALRKRYYTMASFAHPSVMYNRELIEKAGFYPTDTILMEDNVLLGKALLAGLHFANFSDYLIKFRIDEKFFKRRSGLKYGWKYITTRQKMQHILKFSLLSKINILIIGIAKMMPHYILRLFY